MSKREHFQPVQFALLVHDATGEVRSGTISQRDLDGTRRLAESILKVMPEAITVWIHPWLGTTYAASCVEVVRRPASSEPAVASDSGAAALHEPSVDQEPAAEAPQVFSDANGVSSAAPESAIEPTVGPIPIRRQGRSQKARLRASGEPVVSANEREP